LPSMGCPRKIVRMSERLSNKRALVTASAQGIGEAIARAYAAEGADVLATDINSEVLSGLRGVHGIRTRIMDATDGNAIAAVVSAEAPFDILVNCAGVVHHGSVLDCSESDWDQASDLNVKSMFLTIREVLPGMKASGGGSIVNISSICAHRGLPNRFAYSATKAAVIGLTKSVAADFVGDNIRCNAICPGTVESPSLEGRINAFDDPVAARKAFIARQPMGRLGKATEIASIAVHLGSDESVFTSGIQINADGGMSI